MIKQNFLTFAFYFTRFFESITQTGNKNTAEDDEPRERVEKRVLECIIQNFECDSVCTG